jgi:hypothetical protein
MPDTSTPNATTRLFSWMRQGLHAGLATAGAASPDGHLAVPIRLRLNNARDIDVPVTLYGPGEVIGIDPKEVIRTDPHHLMTDFEPNYFPLIEFDRPDFPWLFTPTSADAAGHLQPWICLVVVPKVVASITTVPNLPLPVLECLPIEFPNLGEAWAWAHAQIVEGSARIMDPALDVNAQKKALSEMLRRNPERTLSRLLSPRRLDPNTGYVACVVPTFEVGRKTGLGEPVTAEEEVALRPAWTADAGGNNRVRLPVYYLWEFSTSTEGDFEALARRLERRKLPATVGLRSMSIATPGWGMPAIPPDAPGTVLGLEGALRTPETESTPWPDPTRASFQTSLRAILNAPSEHAESDGQIYIVGPPLYGQWHAKERTVPDADNPPHWFRELNLDPRDRVAAGLGAQVIRSEQEALMASAWEQLARHEEDNQRLKRAQLAEAVGQVLSDKHIQPLPIGILMQVTAPVRSATAKMRALPGSVPPAPVTRLASAAFRRMARPRGPLARRTVAAAKERLGDGVDSTARTPIISIGVSESRAWARALGTMVANPPGRMASASATLAKPEAAENLGPPITSLERLKSALLKELDPRVTVLAVLRSAAPDTESTDLVQFAPEFPQAMYEPLRDYFQDALLPGLEQVLPNTISLLETNPRFIEAYMVGLNHEMGRELLWRGFPTDQRGTCFRQFWDILGRVPPPAPEQLESLKDIKPITSWNDTSHLGENAGSGSAEGQIVLLVRGDLLRRYPRAIVYALEAAWSSDGKRRELGTEERYPIFRATRAPDVTMLGFSLTEEQVRGADTVDGGHPGWFFVLQQQPTEPRFGLDVAVTFGGVPQHWSDLSWGNLAADESALKQIVYIPLDNALNAQTLDNVRWGDNSAQMAFITRQRPFRVAIHSRVWLTGT